jgi:LPXTG-motif cell wall-anchored protein
MSHHRTPRTVRTLLPAAVLTASLLYWGCGTEPPEPPPKPSAPQGLEQLLLDGNRYVGNRTSPKAFTTCGGTEIPIGNGTVEPTNERCPDAEVAVALPKTATNAHLLLLIGMLSAATALVLHRRRHNHNQAGCRWGSGGSRTVNG